MFTARSDLIGWTVVHLNDIYVTGSEIRIQN